MDPVKNIIYEQFSRITKALANPVRLELLDLLCQAPRTVEVLAHLIGYSVATTSHHLRTLLAARLLITEKRGLYVTYRLASKDICVFWMALQQLAQNHLAELHLGAEEFVGDSGTLEQVDRTTLLAQLRRGEVTLIDIRPREEYEAGHLPGAVSAPFERLEEMLSSLPMDRKIVVYGRGPFCMLSVEAVKILRRLNRKAMRMPEGIPQWRAAGLPIEQNLAGC
ncbi:MAG: ArsR/SmtB family transcription factor [Candidatus Neomarinimicrobiota bacterium]